MLVSIAFNKSECDAYMYSFIDITMSGIFYVYMYNYTLAFVSVSTIRVKEESKTLICSFPDINHNIILEFLLVVFEKHTA